jgi:Zn-dependent peptidase ImmA (M78 family)
LQKGDDLVAATKSPKTGDSKAVIDSIRIGYRNFAIERPDEIIQVAGEFYGAADQDKAIIEIANKFSQHQKNQTFIHEILHCICGRFGLKELNNNEHTIVLLATGIYEAILDNPHIFKMADI